MLPLCKKSSQIQWLKKKKEKKKNPTFIISLPLWGAAVFSAQVLTGLTTGCQPELGSHLRPGSFSQSQVVGRIHFFVAVELRLPRFSLLSHEDFPQLQQPDAMWLLASFQPSSTPLGCFMVFKRLFLLGQAHPE